MYNVFDKYLMKRYYFMNITDFITVFTLLMTQKDKNYYYIVYLLSLNLVVQKSPKLISMRKLIKLFISKISYCIL